jgi:hypothetical protein
MELAEISILIRLFLGAAGTFFAILLWSKTRDAAWVLVAIGTLFAYVEIVFSTLLGFGIVRGDGVLIFGVSAFQLLQIALGNLPVIFYTIAFIFVISRRRLP